MAVCKKCGTELKDNEKFCASCGTPVEQASSVAGDVYNNVKNKAGVILDTKDTTGEYEKSEIEANKIKCAIAYIPILFFLPLILCPKNSRYAKFHANQGLLLLILSVLLNVVGAVINLIPVVGGIIWGIVNLIPLAGIIFGIVNTAQGKVKELPYIGGIHIL